MLDVATSFRARILARDRDWRRGALLALGLVVGLLCALFALLAGRDPLTTTPWLPVSGPPAMLLSTGLGLILAATTLRVSGLLMARTAWVRALAEELAPIARNKSERSLVFMALASGVGEELLFRGLLAPSAGLLASSALFAVVHQVRGRARWGWMAWALVMGLALGAIFLSTGSLAGPVVAHVLVNLVNLRRLRETRWEDARSGVDAQKSSAPPFGP